MQHATFFTYIANNNYNFNISTNSYVQKFLFIWQKLLTLSESKLRASKPNETFFFPILLITGSNFVTVELHSSTHPGVAGSSLTSFIWLFRGLEGNFLLKFFSSFWDEWIDLMNELFRSVLCCNYRWL